MVDYYGRWHPETDYTGYPEEKKCDCDRIAERIYKDGYEVKTTLENLVIMVLLYFDSPDMDEEYNRYDLNELFRYVEKSGGWSEFDYVA